MRRILAAVGVLLFSASSYATVVQSPANLVCTSPAVGTTVTCPMAIYRPSTPYSYSAKSVTFTSKPEFTLDAKSCTSGRKTAGGTLCTLRLRYTPQEAGKEVNTTVTVKANQCHTINGGGYNCNTERTFTFKIYGAAVQPPVAWEVGPFGACEGGSGSWQLGSWFPSVGCGSVEQTRTVNCAITADSGLQTRSVACKSSSGDVLPDVECPGEKPATSQSCTPGPSVCGAPPSTARTTNLRNDCPVCEPDPDNGIYCLKMPF